MIEVEVKEKDVEEVKPFPKLMIHRNTRAVMIALSQNYNDIEGLVLEEYGGTYGEYWDGTVWEDFHGTITLTQE